MKWSFVACSLILLLLTPAARSQDTGLPAVSGRREAAWDVSEYNRVLADALLMQLKADSLSRIARDKRIDAREIPEEALKAGLVREAVEIENQAKLIQTEADGLFDRAREMRMAAEIVNLGRDSILRPAKTINGIQVYEYRTGPAGPARPPGLQELSEPAGPSDPAAVLQGTSGPSEPVKAESGVKKGVPFNIQATSPYGEGNPFPLHAMVDQGLVYRIQLGAFSVPAAFDAFGGIVPVYVEEVSGRSLFKYYAGDFQTLASVTAALERIRDSGLTDAFIVAFFEGRQISTEEARKIEYAEFEL